MATVEQLDREIAQKDEELLPLTAAAEERCLERFAAALGPMMSQYARRGAADEPELTEALKTNGGLSQLKATIQSLESGSRELVEKCLRSGPWVHVAPETRYWSSSNFPSAPVTGPDRLSSSGWQDSLKCL